MASLLQHYLDYLTSPAVLLTILILLGPFALERSKNRALRNDSAIGTKIQGCFRLGIFKRSNLDDQYERTGTNDSASSKAKIKALFTFPIKSCKGVELSASEVGPTGLKYDRLFTFAQLLSKPHKSKIATDAGGVQEVSGDWQHEWQFMTQRDFPRLALLQTQLWVPDPKKQSKKNGDDLPNGEANDDRWAANAGYLIVRFAFEPDFNPLGLRTDYVTIPLPLSPSTARAESKKYAYETLSIWKDHPVAINMTNEIPPKDLAKLKYFLGVSNPLALFRVDEHNKRAVTRCLPKDRQGESYSVGFADAFPVHMLNVASVRAVDDELPEKAAVKGKLDARRFRSNIYLSGPPAYAEDSWKKVLIGRCVQRLTHNNGTRMVETEGEFHVACRTARCTLPNTHPDTGIQDRNEPYTTLGKTRKVDKGAYPHPCLGMQVVPLFEQGILRVGDEVEVLETGEHFYEKMFT